MNKEKELMRSNVLDHEPHLALFVEDNDPLIFYKAIAEYASKTLKPTGNLYFEINEALGQETLQAGLDAGFKSGKVIQDLHGKDRIVKLILN